MARLSWNKTRRRFTPKILVDAPKVIDKQCLHITNDDDNDDDNDNNNNNKSAQNNLGRGPRRCKSVPRCGLITTAKVVAGEFITPH